MVSMYVLLPVHPCASVAVTSNEKEPTEVGVPESTPVELRLVPEGSEPVLTANVYGAVPPLAVMV